MFTFYCNAITGSTAPYQRLDILQALNRCRSLTLFEVRTLHEILAKRIRQDLITIH